MAAVLASVLASLSPRSWIVSRSRWGIAAAVAAVVVGASLVPEPVLRAAAGVLPVGGAGSGTGTGTGPLPAWLRPDVVAHLVGAGAISATVARALIGDGRSMPTVIAGATLAATGVTVGVELIQPLVGRNASLVDAIANIGGALGGAAAVVLARRDDGRS